MRSKQKPPVKTNKQQNLCGCYHLEHVNSDFCPGRLKPNIKTNRSANRWQCSRPDCQFSTSDYDSLMRHYEGHDVRQ